MYYRQRVLFFEQALCVTPPSRMERYRTMGVTAGSPLTPSDCAHGLADSGLTGEFVRLPPIPSFFVSSASGVLAWQIQVVFMPRSNQFIDAGKVGSSPGRSSYVCPFGISFFISLGPASRSDAIMFPLLKYISSFTLMVWVIAKWKGILKHAECNLFCLLQCSAPHLICPSIFSWCTEPTPTSLEQWIIKLTSCAWLIIYIHAWE